MRLSQPRDAASSPLDGQVAYERWDRFRTHVRFRQGEHITIIGSTGSGKTLLARELLKPRSFVAVLGTKNTDPELYPAFQAQGYEIVGPGDFEADPPKDDSRIIFRPRITTTSAKGLKSQREAFEVMLDEVWETGGWTLYADEVWTLTVFLGLDVNFSQFWTAGRSENITIVASTQEPVHIPRLAFTAATHLFFFRNSDEQRIKRISELSSGHGPTVRALLPVLPEHEFIYINTRTGLVLRSKVML